MKMKTMKFIISGAFLFSLVYMNKDKIPIPEDIKTFDFIISSGIDIDLNSGGRGGENFENSQNSEDFSISYISSEETGDEENASNANKNIFNVKSDTLNKTIEKLQSLTNKSLSDSHLEYILIGENTAKENLSYFIDYCSKNPRIRLDVNAFITKDMTSEDFIKKILTSKIDANARLNGLVNGKTQLSSAAKKNLKDIMQIFYSKDKTGLIPVLEIEESPIVNIENAENTEKSEKKYTFGFYGFGILKDGKLTGYLPYPLVRSYFILTGNLKISDIEVTGEDGGMSVFSIKNSQNKISFEFDETNMPEKVIFDVNIDTNFDESTSNESLLTSENMNKLNELQSGVIKSEIEEIIEISKKTGADFLNIGDTLSIQHPYKWHIIENEWPDIFKTMEYEINVTAKMKKW